MGLNTPTDSPLITSTNFERVDNISRNWGGIEVSYQEKYPIEGHSWTDMQSDKTKIIVRLGQRGGTCEPRLEQNCPLKRTRNDVGFFNVIPAHQSVWCFADSVHLLRDLQLTFEIDTLIKLMGEGHDYTKLSEPILMVYDTRVMQCARILANLCVDPFPQDVLYGECLTLALLSALLNATHQKTRNSGLSGLAPWQIRIAKDFLQKNFTQDVSLESLAQLTGLSRSWFARAFKVSTGVAPYTWVLQKRIALAQDLLTKTSDPIASIATAVGFADQSHFTKAFRRSVGITPREWQVTQKRKRDQGY
jgi:AraC-like DNA-binding protein